MLSLFDILMIQWCIGVVITCIAMAWLYWLGYCNVLEAIAMIVFWSVGLPVVLLFITWLLSDGLMVLVGKRENADG